MENASLEIQIQIVTEVNNLQLGLITKEECSNRLYDILKDEYYKRTGSSIHSIVVNFNPETKQLELIVNPKE